MKIKTKIIVNSLVWIVVSMGASMFIVWFLMEDYAREFSEKRIGDGAGIIENELAEMRDGLVAIAGRIARQVTGKLELINDPDMRDMAEEGKRDLTVQLYKLSRVGSVPLAVVYGADGEWISFVRPEGDSVRLGFSMENGRMKSARIEAGEETPGYGQWAESEQETVFPARMDVSSEQGHEYGELSGLILVNTWMPVMTEKMDEDTLEIRREPGGMVMASGTVDRSFCERLSKSMGGHVNFFLGGALSVGTLDEYTSTNPGNAGEAGKTGIGAKAQYGERRFSSGAHFEGKFPIFNKNGYLGAVAVLYSKEQLNHFFRRILVSFVVAGACCMLLVIPFSLYFARQIFSPVSKLAAFMELLAKGDFTHKPDIGRKDEIGAMAGAMEKTSQSLGKIIQKNVSISQDLLTLISGQAYSLEKTSVALEEISATSDQNSDNAEEADRHIREIRQMLLETSDAMNRLSASMEAIMASGRETAGVVKTIDDISFQTNLLALNASVEAARAGESGAGFGVVATEVGNLASKTAEAAKNTANLVSRSVDKMSEGSKMAMRVKNKFEEIIKESDTVSGLVNSISTASGEQHQGIEQISKAMNEIEIITRRIVTDAETLSHAMSSFTFVRNDKQGC